uniref:Uncharacterized protein n=1 Tax=Glossina austeni TaxID=7395 RepID=A0A1A9V322_GLOAU
MYENFKRYVSVGVAALLDVVLKQMIILAPLRVHTSQFLRIPENIAERRDQQFNILISSLNHIFAKVLHHSHAYNLQSTQEFKPTDQPQRLEFIEWFMSQQQMDADFSSESTLRLSQ